MTSAIFSVREGRLEVMHGDVGCGLGLQFAEDFWLGEMRPELPYSMKSSVSMEETAGVVRTELVWSCSSSCFRVSVISNFAGSAIF